MKLGSLFIFILTISQILGGNRKKNNRFSIRFNNEALQALPGDSCSRQDWEHWCSPIYRLANSTEAYHIGSLPEVQRLLDKFALLVNGTAHGSDIKGNEKLHAFARSICVGENAMECSRSTSKCVCLNNGFYQLEEEYGRCRIQLGGVCSTSRDPASACVLGGDCIHDICQSNFGKRQMTSFPSILLLFLFQLF